MNSIDITVIVPTFNSEKSIEKCMESILSQENINVEIIIIDAMSRDDTLNIVKSFTRKNVFVISENDDGIYDAINKGISIANGNMIGVLGSDDIYMPKSLSIVNKYFNEDTGIIAGLTKINGEIRRDDPYNLAALISGIPFGHNAMFASRKTYKKVGLYDLSYRICSDAQWVHRAIKAGIECLKINEVFVDFCDTGVSSTNAEEIMAESYRAIQENFPFLSTEEAKYLLYAYRRWGDCNYIHDLLKKYKKNEIFTKSITEAFPQNKDLKMKNNPRWKLYKFLPSFIRD